MRDPTVITIVSMFACVIGLNIGIALERSSFKAEAIEHGAAHYDEKTAKFTWKEKQK